MSKTVILVTGAGGNTGEAISRHLLQKADKNKYIIKVGARKIGPRVQHLIDLGAEFVPMDFMDPKGLCQALKVRKAL